MDGERKLPLSHAPRKSGSANRRKQRIVNFRATDEERAVIKNEADMARLTVGSYLRQKVLAAPQTGVRRKASADVVALAKLTAELNRIGGNINQIARGVNCGEQLESEWLREALTCLLQTMKTARAAMGFQS